MLERFSGSETLLVADDEPIVLSLARSILSRYGYQVIPAADGGEALELCQSRPAAIDLLLTDVVMPRMNGPELAHSLKEINGGVKCIFMSGYDPDHLRNHKTHKLGCDFLKKPFTPEGLLRKVRETLDAEPSKSETSGVPTPKY